MKKRVFDDTAKKRIILLVESVFAILPFDGRIQYRWEHVGEGTFFDTKTGAINRDPYILIVNIDWYENAGDEEIKFIIRHESRHLYQRNQVAKLRYGGQLLEAEDEIRNWAYEFDHYISNTPATEIQHFQQCCEYNAYVFATFISNIENMNFDYSISYIDYPGIGDMVAQKVSNMIQKLPIETLIKYQDFFRNQTM